MVKRSRLWEKQHKNICLDMNLYKDISNKKKKGQTYNDFIKFLMGDNR